MDLAFAFAVATSLIGWALVVGRLADRALGAALLPASCVVLLAAKLALLLGVFLPFRIAVLVGGLALVAMTAWREPRRLREALSAPATQVFLAGVAILCLANRHIQFASWDEFSFWGKIARYVALEETFPAPGRFDGFLDYPFGLAAFEALFVLPGRFAEPGIVVGALVLVLAAVAALLDRMSWRRDWPLVASVLVIAFATSYLVQARPWGSILPDRIVAIVAAGGFAVYWRGGGAGRGLALLMPVLVALPLMKDAGGALVLALLVAVVFDQVMRYAAGERVAGAVLALAAAVAALVASRAAWAWHLAQTGAGTTFSRDGGTILARLRAPDFGENAAAVLATFGERLATAAIARPGAPTLAIWLSVILAVAFAAAVAAERRAVAGRIIIGTAVLAVMGAVYVGGLLLLYLFSFGAYEGSRAAAFERYVAGYLLFWLLAGLAWIEPPWPLGRVRRSIWSVVLIAIAAGATAFAYPAIRADVRGYLAGRPAGKEIPRLRREVQAFVADAGPGPASIVFTGSTGIDYFVAAYEMTPRLVVPPVCFSPGPARFEGDVWSCDVPPETFLEAVRKTGQLGIGHADDLFWQKYGTLFAAGARESGARWFTLRDGLLAPAE